MELQFTARLFDELEALYPDSNAAGGAAHYRVAGANGTTAGVHILMTGLTPGVPVSIEVEGPHTAFRLSELLPVPVEVNTGAKQRSAYLHDDVNETVLRKAPFYIYEVLKPIYNVLMPTGVSAAAAFKTLIEYVREYTEEEWKLTVSHAGQTQTLSLTVAKYPAVVPKAGRDTHRYVNWISYANIARMHHVEMDSDAYFTLLNRYLRAAVYSRQNIMNLSPGMFFSLKKGVVKLDEKRLDRYIEAGKRAGIAYFNGMAFCGRADGQADNDEFYNSLPHDTFTSPDQVAAAFRKVAFDKFDNGVDVRVSLGGALVTSPEGQRILSLQARLLYAYLKKKGLTDCWQQCVMDEPNDALAPQYRIASEIVHKEMPGIPTLEPVLPTHALDGAVDIWCPTNETYENDREYYDVRVAAGDRLYVYTCLTPGGRYMNRMLDMQRLRQTYLGWVPAIYPNVSGYLHWGFNQYPPFIDPYGRSACMFSEQEMEFHPKRALFLPAGDYCVIYPGYEGPCLSTRSEAQRIGLEDLCLLEKLPSQKRANLARRLVRGYADYDLDIAKYRAVKEELLRAQ